MLNFLTQAEITLMTLSVIISNFGKHRRHYTAVTQAESSWVNWTCVKSVEFPLKSSAQICNSSLLELPNLCSIITDINYFLCHSTNLLFSPELIHFESVQFDLIKSNSVPIQFDLFLDDSVRTDTRRLWLLLLLTCQFTSLLYIVYILYSSYVCYVS